jgi:hypothetical protein
VGADPRRGPHLQAIIDEILADIDVEGLLASPAGTVLETSYFPPVSAEPAAGSAFVAADTATAGGLGEQLAEAGATKEDVLRYLDGDRGLRSVRRRLPDEITGETLRIPGSTRTDGTWEWHESLNYLVRRHDVHVPAPLMGEMIRRRFRAEAE